MRRSSGKSGSSLIELLVVVTILGILAAIIVPRISVTASTAKEKVDAENRVLINSAVERYYVLEGDWPADLTVLDGDLEYFPDGIPVDPVTNSAYSLNSTTHRLD
ncbi:competence type IV pilus major pilin ComGC [Aeoliella mucimassa]|uniref:Fimbrial protein n=1 Tax=Aeoliella mucimassa TaxID=2527972 RepID=A0A518AUW7_9BACT|nr:prepilin-type N-terminal cleavage/methylation domain-containing protein [Aeoliella mucimassa]QDU58508.1 Fimbrial protein precursor [Aeoliella mucimassa]